VVGRWRKKGRLWEEKMGGEDGGEEGGGRGKKSRAAFALMPKLVIPQKKYQNGKLQVLEQTIISKRALHTSP
jgi:hypothetical protein